MAEEPRKRGKVASGIVTGLALLAALGLHVLTKQAEAKYYYHVGSCVTVDGFDQADVDCAAKGLRFQVATTVVNAELDVCNRARWPERLRRDHHCRMIGWRSLALDHQRFLARLGHRRRSSDEKSRRPSLSNEAMSCSGVSLGRADSVDCRQSA